MFQAIQKALPDGWVIFNDEKMIESISMEIIAFGNRFVPSSKLI